jgi:hypothetical protein
LYDQILAPSRRMAYRVGSLNTNLRSHRRSGSDQSEKVLSLVV